MSYIQNQENQENKFSDKYHNNDFSNNKKYNTSQQMTYYTDISEQLQASEIYSKQQLNFQEEQGQISQKFRSRSQLSYNQRGQNKNEYNYQTQNQLFQTKSNYKLNQENKLSQQQKYKKLLKSFNNCRETEEDQKFRIQIQNQVEILRKLSCEQEEKSEDEFSQKSGEKQKQIQNKNQNQKENQNQNWSQKLSQKQNLNRIKQQGRKQVCYSSLDNRVNYSNKVNLMNSQQEQERNFKLMQKTIKQSKNRTEIEKNQVINLYKKNNSLVSNMMKIFSDEQENQKIQEKKENYEKSGFLSENQFSNKIWRSNKNNQQNLQNREGIKQNNENESGIVFQTIQKKFKKGGNLSLGKMDDQSKFGSFSVKNQENKNQGQKNQNQNQNSNFSQNQFSSKTSKFLDEIDRLNQQSQDCKKQINFQKSSSPVKIEQSRFLKGLQDMGVANFRQNKVYKLLNLSSQNLAIDGDFSVYNNNTNNFSNNFTNNNNTNNNTQSFQVQNQVSRNTSRLFNLNKNQVLKNQSGRGFNSSQGFYNLDNQGKKQNYSQQFSKILEEDEEILNKRENNIRNKNHNKGLKFDDQRRAIKKKKQSYNNLKNQGFQRGENSVKIDEVKNSSQFQNKNVNLNESFSSVFNFSQVSESSNFKSRSFRNSSLNFGAKISQSKNNYNNLKKKNDYLKNNGDQKAKYGQSNQIQLQNKSQIFKEQQQNQGEQSLNNSYLQDKGKQGLFEKKINKNIDYKYSIFSYLKLIKCKLPSQYQLLLNIQYQFLEKNQFYEVCQLLFQLLAICIDHDLFSVFIGTLKFIGDLGFEMGEYDKAMGFYYELYKLCIKIGNFQYQYKAVFGMANVCIKKGHFEDALKMLKKSIFYAWYLEDLDKELDCYEKVSFCFYNLSCLDECIYYHNRALKGQREQDNLEKTQKIRQIESLKEKILAGDCLHFCSGHFLQAKLPVLSLEQFPYRDKIEDYQFNFKFVFQQEKEEEVEQSIIFDDYDNINENENENEKSKDQSNMQENSNLNFKSYDQIKNDQEFQHNVSEEKNTSKQNEIYQNNQDQMENMRERINSSIEDYNYANTKISFDLNQNSNFDFNKSQQIKIQNLNQNQDLVKSIMRSQIQQKGDKQKLQENNRDNNTSSKNNFCQKNLSSGAKLRQKYSENQEMWLEMKYQDIKEQYFQEKDNELNLDFPKYEEKFEKPQIVKQIMRKFRIYDQEDPKQRTNYKNLQYEYIQNQVFDRKRRFSKENTQKGRFEQIKREIAKELKIESYQDQNQNKNKSKIFKNNQAKQLQQKNKRSVTDFMLYENGENYKQVYKYYKELNKKRNNQAQQNLLLSKGINRDAINNKIYLTSNGQNEGDQKDKKAKFQYRMFLDNLFVNGKVQI